MDTALKILGIVLMSLAIVVCIFMIFSYRRTRIAAKKIDHLVEDITYKIEVLSPTIDSLAKLGKFVDLFDNILKEKTQNLIKYTSKNEEGLYKIVKEVKEVWKETKQQVEKDKKQDKEEKE